MIDIFTEITKGKDLYGDDLHVKVLQLSEKWQVFM